MTVRQIARRITTQATGRANRALVGTFKSVTRRYAVKRAWLQRRAERHNAALAETGHYTAAQYLRHVIGATPEFVKAYASAFGRAAAAAHRKLFGAEPAQDGLTVIGNHPRFTSIAVYGPAERAALEQAARTHKATAALAANTPAPAAETPAAPTQTAYPTHIIQATTTTGRYQVVQPNRSTRPVEDGADLDWDTAANLRNRLNAVLIGA